MKTIKPIIRKNVKFLSVKLSGTKTLLPKGGADSVPKTACCNFHFEGGTMDEV